MQGFNGLMLVLLLSIIMSSLASTINSAATLYTLDFYKKRNPAASERKVVLVARLFSMAIVLAGISAFPLIKTLDTRIFTLLIYIPVFIAPPVVAIFLSGLFSNKVNSKGVLWTLVAAGVSAIIKIMSDLEIFGFNAIIIRDIHYLNFTVFLFVVSLLVLYAASTIAVWKSSEKRPTAKMSVINGVSDSLSWGKDSVSLMPIRINTALSISLAVLMIGIWIFTI
jgi:SSS family solute:Na+ symporter